MKRWIAGILAVGLLGTMVLTAPGSAEAWSGRGHGNYNHNNNNFWGAFGVGAVAGLVVGSIFAPPVYAAPPVIYQPAPVYMAPPPVAYQSAPVYYGPPPVAYQSAPAYYAPAPVCQNYWVNGYWYGPNWIAGHWEQACR